MRQVESKQGCRELQLRTLQPSTLLERRAVDDEHGHVQSRTTRSAKTPFSRRPRTCRKDIDGLAVSNASVEALQPFTDLQVRSILSDSFGYAQQKSPRESCGRMIRCWFSRRCFDGQKTRNVMTDSDDRGKRQPYIRGRRPGVGTEKLVNENE